MILFSKMQLFLFRDTCSSFDKCDQHFAQYIPLKLIDLQIRVRNGPLKNDIISTQPNSSKSQYPHKNLISKLLRKISKPRTQHRGNTCGWLNTKRDMDHIPNEPCHMTSKNKCCIVSTKLKKNI